MLRLALALCLLAAPAFAQPGYYRVTGVAADDTLNVREAPDAASADIGDLLPDTGGVEVIETDESGDWGRIVWQEANGWVAMRFLEPDPVPKIGESKLPQGLLCGGTEPFWSVRYTGDSATYSDTEMNVMILPFNDSLAAAARAGFPVALRHRSDQAASLSVIRAQICSDGMSDRDYPYAIALLIRSLQGEALYEGCCSLPLDAGTN